MFAAHLRTNLGFHFVKKTVHSVMTHAKLVSEW